MPSRRKGASTKKTSIKNSVELFGEFGLIDTIASIIGDKKKSRNGGTILRAIGDDAAVIRTSPNKVLVFTTDALVERIHFDLTFDSPHNVGWKAMVASLSDIAAMNAAPLAAVVSIALPKKTDTGIIKKLYEGMNKAAEHYSCPIVGGDTTASRSGIFISVAILGACNEKEITYRSGAQPGDIVCVSGDLGRCTAALQVLKTNKKQFDAKKIPSEVHAAIMQKHNQPLPRFDILQKLRRAKISLTSIIDISDGLSSELHHIARQSKAGIEIDAERIPINNAVKKLAAKFGADPIAWALHSGEEYELLFTVNPKYRAKLAAVSGVSMIGSVSSGKGVWVKDKTGRKSLPAKGYVHF